MPRRGLPAHLLSVGGVSVLARHRAKKGAAGRVGDGICHCQRACSWPSRSREAGGGRTAEVQPRSILVPRARLMRRSEDHESREAHPLFKPSCQIVAGECRTVCPLSFVLGSKYSSRYSARQPGRRVGHFPYCTPEGLEAWQGRNALMVASRGTFLVFVSLVTPKGKTSTAHPHHKTDNPSNGWRG